MSKATPVEPVDPGKKTSDILELSGDEATVQMSKLSENCVWNGVEFTQGQRVSVDGKCYECSFGNWVQMEE